MGQGCRQLIYLQAYARSRTDRPELADIVAVNATAELPADEDGQRAAKRQRIYPDHKAMSSIIEGMRQGRLHQVRIMRDQGPTHAFTQTAPQISVNHKLPLSFKECHESLLERVFIFTCKPGSFGHLLIYLPFS